MAAIKVNSHSVVVNKGPVVDDKGQKMDKTDSVQPIPPTEDPKKVAAMEVLYSFFPLKTMETVHDCYRQINADRSIWPLLVSLLFTFHTGLKGSLKRVAGYHKKLRQLIFSCSYRSFFLQHGYEIGRLDKIRSYHYTSSSNV